MKSPRTMKALEDLGRVRLSDSFFMRDMLYSEISNHFGIPNIPDNPDLAIETGQQLCQNLLEPLQEKFGRISIRSAFRSAKLNKFGNEKKLGCSRNEANYARHIWDHLDADGYKGALATIVINRYVPYYDDTKNWQAIAWYIHDHLPYSSLYFYPKLCAFNIGWHEKPVKRIDSYVAPKGCLTKPGMHNHSDDHSLFYEEMFSRLKTDCKA